MNVSEKETGESQPAETLPDTRDDAGAGVKLITDIMSSICLAFGLRPQLQTCASALREEGEHERAEALEAFAGKLLASDHAVAPANGLPAAFPNLPVADVITPELPPAISVVPAAEVPKYLLHAPFWSPVHFGRAGETIDFNGVPNRFMEPLNSAAAARVASVGRR
jgi:hypothetical protein